MTRPEDAGRTEHYGQAPHHGAQQAYGQQPYGSPPYGQPPYGPPGYPPPSYAVPYRRPTSTLAVVALFLSFVFAPAGLITGIVARRQIRQTQEDGDGLALAAIIVGGIITGFFVLLIGIWVLAVVALANNGFS